MKTSAGLWIDHRETVIVTLAPTGPSILRIKSQVEKQLRRVGDGTGGSFPAQAVPPDDSREREYQGDLARYYDEIIAHLGAAEEILIFGPGEAKGELKKRMEKDGGHACHVTLETDDKMTEPQIVARVRQHFQPWAPRMGARRVVRQSLTLNPL